MEQRVWHAAYDPGVPPSLRYDDLTLPECLHRSAARWGGRVALHWFGARITYRELAGRVDRLATALAGMDVGPGSRVAVQLPNSPETVVAVFAALQCGAQVVMTNPLYTPREIEHQWNDSRCEVAVIADHLLARHGEHLRGKVPVRHWIVASLVDSMPFPTSLLARWKLSRKDPPLVARLPRRENEHRLAALLRRTAPAPPRPPLRQQDVAVLQYTGGTTGVSKAAMLTHGNLMANVQQCRAWMVTFEDGQEVFLAALPYFHIFGLTVCLLLPVAMGATIVVEPDPRNVERLLAALSQQHVTLFPAVPAMLNALSGHPRLEQVDLRSVRGIFSGSAPLPLDVMRRFEQLTGAVVFEGFGLTETSPATHLNPLLGERKPGSIGLPLPDTDCRITSIDDPGHELPPGAEGELHIRGPQVMKGYWNRPDETAAALRDGWLATGDLATMDEQGYFRIVGRKKDMILASGYNVYPDEVDQVLSDHPAVREACTIGVPDERRGETVKSFVVLEPGAQVSPEELVAHCRENLAAYKAPRRIEFRDELPKSAVMKVLRRELRRQELEKRGPR